MCLLLVGKHPKFFNSFGNITKVIYSSGSCVIPKKAFFHVQNIQLDKFHPENSIGSGILNVACMQKIKIGHCAKFRDYNKCFLLLLFPVA